MLRRAVESPGRFADGVRGRYLRTGDRIRAAGGTLVDRPTSSPIERHHHHHASFSTSTVWQPSFALHATMVMPPASARSVAPGHRSANPTPALVQTRLVIPASSPGLSTRTSLDRVPTATTATADRATLTRPGRAAPATPLDEVRATPRIRRAETVVARQSASADERLAPTTEAGRSAASVPQSSSWPTTSPGHAVPVPVPPAEVDRITRQVISAIDQRLSAYRERQGRG